MPSGKQTIMEKSSNGNVIKLLKDIKRNTKKTDYNSGLDVSPKRQYLGSFSFAGDEIPKELKAAEYDDEFEMTVKIRISEVADSWGEKDEKRLTVQIKKIISMESGKEDA